MIAICCQYPHLTKWDSFFLSFYHRDGFYIFFSIVLRTDSKFIFQFTLFDFLKIQPIH